MHCSECSQWISLYLDELLSEEQVARWQEHLTLCQDCRAEWESMRVLSAVLEAEPTVSPAPGFVDRVSLRLQQREVRRSRFFGSLKLIAGTAGLWGAAAIALLLVLLLWQPSARVLALEVAPSLLETAWTILLVLGRALGSVLYALSRRPTWLLLPGYVIVALGITLLWTRVLQRLRQPVME